MHCFKIAFCFQKHTKTVFIKHLKIGILESSLYMFIKKQAYFYWAKTFTYSSPVFHYRLGRPDEKIEKSFMF